MSLLQIHEPGMTPEPHERRPVLGIDLGTTHSVVACMKGDAPVALEDDQGHSLIPSVTYYQDGETYIGATAFEAAQAQGTHPMQAIKRLMGRSSAEAAAQFPEWKEALISDGEAVPTYRLDGSEHTPISISGDILAHVRQVAVDALERDVMQAVITVPAYFDDAARQATRQAAELAGLEVLRLINEPTAAALAYGLEHGKEGVYAVYDLGGGTFDMSILNLEGGVFQVLATAGDTALGGHDVDVAIAGYLRGEYGVEGQEVQAVARHMKEALSKVERIDEEIGGLMVSLDAQTLDTLAAPLIARTLTISTQVLEDANVISGGLQGVVLVGGSTRLNAVRKAVEGHFDCPVYDDLDPDRVVAYGAAVQAQALTQGGDHLLLDVTPLSLGLETMGGIVEKLIYRNTPIPAEATQEFTTYQDGQTGMQIHVVQGEREMVDQCRSLARFELTGIPPLPAGITRVEVRFTIDADGLLTVSAKEQETGLSQTVEVKPSYGLPIDTIEQMIRESMEKGREDIMQRLLAEARVEAQRTIEETRSALKQDDDLLDEEEKTAIVKAIENTQGVLSADDRDAIDAAHEGLKRAIELFAERRMNAAVQKALAGSRVSDM